MGLCGNLAKYFIVHRAVRKDCSFILDTVLTFVQVVAKFIFCLCTIFVVPKSIHNPPPLTEGFFGVCILPPPPHTHTPGNCNLVPYSSFKTFGFASPLPLGISIDLPWGRYGYFLEVHVVKCVDMFLLLGVKMLNSFPERDGKLGLVKVYHVHRIDFGPFKNIIL